MHPNKTELKPLEYLLASAEDSFLVQRDFLEKSKLLLVQVAQMMGECFRNGGKLLIFGNGGSAADAQHMAAEMVGRMLVDRRPLPAIALTTDTSNLTAIGNDFGFEYVFSKQIEALARPGDLVFGISTSGNSKNVILAMEAAKKQGCKTICMTGGSGGALKALSDICLNASLGKNSSRIQEAHSFAIHSLVDLMDRFYLT